MSVFTGTSRNRQSTGEVAPGAVLEADRPNGVGGAASSSVAEAPTEETSGALAPALASQPPVSTDLDYGDESGAGLEGLDSSEMLVPFVRMLQALSPACVEGSPAYDPSLRPGMIIHTATGEAYPKELGCGFIPCARDASYTEWVPINPAAGGGGGGGFRGTWAHDDSRIEQMIKAQGAFKKLVTGEGTELVETRTIYGLIVPRSADGAWMSELATNGVVSFSSTQLKKYKMIITRLQGLLQGKMRMINGKKVFPPMWSWRWNLGTQPEKNKSGSYYGWRLTLAEETGNASMIFPNDELFQMASSLYHLVKGGLARADFATSGVAAEATAAGASSQSDTDIDEQIPF